jgi:hypothetical protein
MGTLAAQFLASYSSLSQMLFMTSTSPRSSEPHSLICFSITPR